MIFDVAKNNWKNSSVIKEFDAELVDFIFNEKIFVAFATKVFVSEINTA